MNKKLYLSLAKNNIKKNKSSFYPFMLSAIAMIANGKDFTETLPYLSC